MWRRIVDGRPRWTSLIGMVRACLRDDRGSSTQHPACLSCLLPSSSHHHPNRSTVELSLYILFFSHCSVFSIVTGGCGICLIVSSLL